MALKKELGSLYKILVSTAQSLPKRTQNRTMAEIESMFHNYTETESEVLLYNLKKQAENKLLIMEMSLPEKEKTGGNGTEKQEREITEVSGIRSFHFKDNKIHEGASEQKFFPEYSNWYGGNVDPQDLRRHKDLLDRQHYSGPFWEGRTRNPSVLDEENPVYDYAEPEEHPPESLRKLKEEDSFEGIKR